MNEKTLYNIANTKHPLNAANRMAFIEGYKEGYDTAKKVLRAKERECKHRHKIQIGLLNNGSPIWKCSNCGDLKFSM